jgi:uncharacterized damage-inducible protein DinB
VSKAVVRELFGYMDWATEKLYACAEELSDAQLDQPFEMGPGSTRKTLTHLRAAERLWLERWKGNGKVQFAGLETSLPLAKLHDEVHQLSRERNEWVAGLNEAALNAPITFTLRSGDTLTLPLIDLILHVCNHHVYHRAQILNMFRHLGLKSDWLELLALHREQPGRAPLPVTKEIISKLYAYNDWANDALLAAADALPAEELDRPFEMGLGSLRKTLCHILDAEPWWLTNWTEGPGQLFPAADATVSIADLKNRAARTARRRNEFLAGRSAEDLARSMEALARAGKMVSFPMADVIVHLTFHGTHHRAQANNMLRRLGQKPLGMDLLLWLREQK